MDIIFDQVNKNFGNKKVINNFSYTFKEKSYAIIGDNGSGKKINRCSYRSNSKRRSSKNRGGSKGNSKMGEKPVSLKTAVKMLREYYHKIIKGSEISFESKSFNLFQSINTSLNLLKMQLRIF